MRPLSERGGFVGLPGSSVSLARTLFVGPDVFLANTLMPSILSLPLQNCLLKTRKEKSFLAPVWWYSEFVADSVVMFLCRCIYPTRTVCWLCLVPSQHPGHLSHYLAQTESFSVCVNVSPPVFSWLPNKHWSFYLSCCTTIASAAVPKLLIPLSTQARFSHCLEMEKKLTWN